MGATTPQAKARLGVMVEGKGGRGPLGEGGGGAVLGLIGH